MRGKEEKEPPDSSRKPAPEHEISFKQEASLLLRSETREEVMGDGGVCRMERLGTKWAATPSPQD